MKPKHKLSHQQEQQLIAGPQDFADSDELLRFDAAQTIVPSGVAQRLRKTLGGAPARSWWQKMLGL